VHPYRLLLVPVTLMLGLYAEWAALERSPLQEAVAGNELRLAVADFVVGLVLVACGLVAWARRPESRTGLLLCVAGIAWFLGTFAASGRSGYADFGALFLTLHRGPLAHALLSYPTGHLERWTERAAVVFAYAVSAIAVVGKSPQGAIALATVLLVVGVDRFLRAVGPQRRAYAAAAAGSTAFAAVLLFSGFARLAGSGFSVDRGVLWAYEVVVAAIAIGLTIDLVLGRWVGATVTGLVVDLGEVDEAGTLRDRLASALGDPSLVLGYWLPHRGTYVDDRGRELALPRDSGERRVTVVRDGDEPVAALVHDAGALAVPELVQSVSAAARLALANARLQAEVRRQVEELEASRRRLVEAGDTERRRLERELREGAERRLVEIDSLLRKARSCSHGGLDGMLDETQAKLEGTRSDLREFARGIHPSVLTEQGLRGALEELAERAPVRVELRVPDTRYPGPVESAAYFVCSEALANVGKYAQASSAVVDVSEVNHGLRVFVSDDGVGGANVAKGSGLRGLADRVEALAGRLTVTSPPGEGTQVVAEFPIA
jgi:signal transduction histidine kinase